MPLPLHGSSVPKTSQIHLFLLLKLYQHQQRNKARSLLLVQTPWTGCSVHVHLPAGTFLPDRGVFDALFSSSIWIGSGWEWDICCQTGVTKYPVRSGSSVLVDTCVTWGREGGLVRLGGNIERIDSSPQIWGMQCCAHIPPQDCCVKMLLWQEGRWGKHSIPSGLRKLSGSQKCAGLVRNPATSCRNTLPESGPGWAAVTDSVFSCPEPESNCFSWPRVFAEVVPSQDRKLFDLGC